MDNATNIKLEIWLFLKNLLEIKKNPNAFDNQTINLIETVQDTIVELLNQFKNKSVNALTSSNNEYELLRDINKDEFQFQRFLVCQMCNTHMDPSEAELQAHIFGRIHTSNAEKLGRKSHTPLSNSLASIALSSESDVIKIEVDQIEEKLKPNDVHSSKLDRILETLVKKTSIVEIIYHSCNLSSTITNSEIHMYVQQSLLLSISELYGNVILYPHGSRVYNVASMDCDFNILMDFDGIYVSKEEILVLRNNVEALLKKHPKYWKDVEITDCEIFGPCLKAFNNIGSIQCTLLFGFDAAVVVSTTKLLKFIFNVQPACRQLILYLKIWQETINENMDKNEIPFEFSTYLMSILVIFIFQYRKIVPPLVKIQPIKEKHYEGIEVECAGLIKTNVKISIEEYILNFFSFYGHYYQSKQHIISTYDGELLSKKSSNLMNSSCMCVLDLFDNQENIARNISQSSLETFQKYCRMTAQLMKLNVLTKQWNNVSGNEITDEMDTVNAPETISIPNDVDKNAIAEPCKQITENNVGPTCTDQSLRSLISQCVQENSIRSMINEGQAEYKRLNRIQQYRAVRNLIRTTLKNAELYFYGSRIYGAGSEASDLNIFVDFDKLHNTIRKLPWQSLVNLKNYTKELLKKQPDLFTIIETNDNIMKYSPLLKLYLPHHRLYCTLSFATGVPVAECNLIKDLFAAQTLCFELIHYIKQWRDKLNAHLPESEKFMFSNYLITILVITFSQLQYLIPSVYDLQKDQREKIYCGDIPVHYEEPKCTKPRKTLSEYLIYFFKFCGDSYDPEMHLISPYYGAFLSRRNPEDQQHNHPEWLRNCPMFVADIFIFANIAAEVKQNELDSFRRCCRMTMEELCAINTSRINICVNRVDQPAPNLKTETLTKSKVVTSDSSRKVNFSSFFEFPENVIKNITSHKFTTMTIMEGLRLADKIKTVDYSEIVTRLNHLLKPICQYPLKCYPFGSRLYGVGTTTSDLNILLDFGDFYNNRAKIISKNQMEEICKIALEVLKDYDSTWENIELDMNCHNAPAIKVIYKPQAVRCNLIFGNSTAVATTHFIESVLDKQKMCRRLIIYLKQWQHEIIKNSPDSFNFSSYVITLMVIISFQEKMLLPSVSAFRSKMEPCGGFLVCKEMNDCPKTNSAFETYLLDFFELYGFVYNPNAHILSVYFGGLIKRSMHLNQVPTTELMNFFKRINGHSKVWENSAMYMQDIFKNNCNVTSNVTPQGIEYFQKMCRISAKILKDSRKFE